jgi:hypothetical protein
VSSQADERAASTGTQVTLRPCALEDCGDVRVAVQPRHEHVVGAGPAQGLEVRLVDELRVVNEDDPADAIAEVPKENPELNKAIIFWGRTAPVAPVCGTLASSVQFAQTTIASTSVATRRPGNGSIDEPLSDHF